MKGIVVLVMVACCSIPAFCQQGAGKALLGNFAHIEKQVLRQSMKHRYVSPSVSILENITIPNLPGTPTVTFRLPFVAGTEKSTASILPPNDVFPLIFSKGPRAMFPKKMFVPQDFLSKEKNFYRGMKLTSLEDVENLLKNGLELGKSADFPDKIYVTSEASFAVAYAMPSTSYNSFCEIEANLPVLIKIPATDELRQFSPEVFRYHETFRRNVPARFISDIWVFLEVNKKPDWYKVVLENNELVFIHAPGEMRPWSDGLVKEKNK